VLFGAGDLTFVTLGESLVHIFRLHLRQAGPLEALVDLDDTCRYAAAGQALVIRTSSLLDGKGHVLGNTDR